MAWISCLDFRFGEEELERWLDGGGVLGVFRIGSVEGEEWWGRRRVRHVALKICMTSVCVDRMALEWE